MPPDVQYQVACKVLQVRHFPSSFSEANIVSFLKTHGASSVAVPRKGQAFATFNSEAGARHAMNAIHQLQLSDKRLLVTFARSNHHIPVLPPPGASSDPSDSLSESEKLIEKVHAIAPNLGLNYILNPMVKYKYPPLTDEILANICVALRSNPNFYTQLLHLMNKMNLPAPFRRRADPSKIFKRPELRDISTEITSESGSDLSDEEIRSSRKPSLLTTTSAIIPNKKTRQPKTLRPPVKLLPPKNKPVRDVSECFDITGFPIRKMELPTIPELASKPSTNSEIQEVGFGLLQPPPPEDPPVEEPPPRFNWTSVAFTAYNSMERITVRDAIDHPAFRNYEEGEPCVRLYVKNVAKTVTEQDLFLLFGQFVPDDEAERAIFDIRLMKSGRMRGQAFVTFGSTMPAMKAVEELNRVILKGKPLAVQFAKQPHP